MPKVVEITVIDGAVWCKIELNRNTDVTDQLTLWTNDEIRQHDEDLLRRFVLDQVERFLEDHT